SSCSEKENPGQDCVGDQHGEKGLDDRGGGGLADTFGAAFDMQTGVTSDGDDDPREDGALDHAGIQIPGIGTFQRAQHVTGGVEIEREPANGPTAKNANVISENGEGRKHDEHGEKTWHDEVLD